MSPRASCRDTRTCSRPPSVAALFNEALPEDYPFFNQQADGQISAIVNDLAEGATRRPRSPRPSTASRTPASAGRPVQCDRRALGHHHAPTKGEIVSRYEKQAAKVQSQFEKV